MAGTAMSELSLGQSWYVGGKEEENEPDNIIDYDMTGYDFSREDRRPENPYPRSILKR